MRQALIDEFSYASEDPFIGAYFGHSRGGKPERPAVFEKALSRLSKRKPAATDSFWDEVIARGSTWMSIFMPVVPPMCPKRGPLVVVANHPYGVLDGIAICWLVAQRRKDFKILINSVLCRAREMADHVLPIDFEPTPQALETNLQSRKLARAHLEKRGCGDCLSLGRHCHNAAFFPAKAMRRALGAAGRAIGAAHQSRRFCRCYFAGQNSLFPMGQPCQLCHARRL